MPDEETSLERIFGKERLAATFTPLELEIFKLVRDGKTNHEIAAELGLTAQEVKTTVRTIVQKLRPFSIDYFPSRSPIARGTGWA